MRKAWEYNRAFSEQEVLFLNALDVLLGMRSFVTEKRSESMIYMWGGNVTESLFPVFNIPMYIQEYENLGMMSIRRSP